MNGQRKSSRNEITVETRRRGVRSDEDAREDGDSLGRSTRRDTAELSPKYKQRGNE